MQIYGHLLMTSDVVLILGGAMMYWLCPRLRRNWILGYGSSRSMVNDDAWQSANRFAGMTLALLSLVTMSLHVTLRTTIVESELGQAVSAGAILALPLVVMYLTEKYLAHVFKN
jgi:uncharacterized membrane protein